MATGFLAKKRTLFAKNNERPASSTGVNLNNDILHEVLVNDMPVKHYPESKEYGLPYDQIAIDIRRGRIVFYYGTKRLAQLDVDMSGDPDTLHIHDLEGHIRMRVKAS